MTQVFFLVQWSLQKVPLRWKQVQEEGATEAGGVLFLYTISKTQNVNETGRLVASKSVKAKNQIGLAALKRP
jgi:hypothetical protein